MKEKERACQRLLLQGRTNQRECLALLDEVIEAMAAKGHSRVLMYDARRFVTSPSVFPPRHELVEAYLNRPDVRAALHADTCPHRFVECSDKPFDALVHLEGQGVMRELAECLEAGVVVLVFAGVHDVICNHVGIERAIRRLEWSGRQGFLESGPSVWSLRSAPVGYITSYANLHLLRVLGSGHMVPLDQPEVAVQMIRWLLSDGTQLGEVVTRIEASTSESCEASEGVQPVVLPACKEAGHVSEILRPTTAVKVQTAVMTDSVCSLDGKVRSSCSVIMSLLISNAYVGHLSLHSLQDVLLGDLRHALLQQTSTIPLHRFSVVSSFRGINDYEFQLDMVGPRQVVIGSVRSLVTQALNKSSPLMRGLLTGSLVSVSFHHNTPAYSVSYPISLGDAWSIAHIYYHHIIVLVVFCFCILCSCLYTRCLWGCLNTIFRNRCRSIEVARKNSH
jgi:hypothetical protein